MAREIRFEIPGRGTMKGWATGSDAEIECVVVRHEMGDGTFAEERVWCVIQPPAPAAEEAAPESADG
jgi:hypothetical protein